MRTFLLRLAVVALVVYGAHDLWQRRTIHHGAGKQVAPSSPVQLAAPQEVVAEKGEFRLTRLAKYELTARVLSRETYTFDEGAKLAPLDLALGWGPMSDEAVLAQLELWQGHRFYYYEWEGQPPISPALIRTHSANTHIIPADAAIRRKVLNFPKGAVVHLTGELVLATTAAGYRWSSSLTREDAGNGACELMLVHAAERVDGP